MYSVYTLLQDYSFLHETDLQANLTELQEYYPEAEKPDNDVLEDRMYFYDDKDELRYK
ncbi:MAG TPA: hypothetical protein PKM63_12470 [Panacibacter sp.]|nr:hypothetical protein [Panacibacter sp.]HNP45095.1 hypothetical protein [Panacibacter sp.]